MLLCLTFIICFKKPMSGISYTIKTAKITTVRGSSIYLRLSFSHKQKVTFFMTQLMIHVLIETVICNYSKFMFAIGVFILS